MMADKPDIKEDRRHADTVTRSREKLRLAYSKENDENRYLPTMADFGRPSSTDKCVSSRRVSSRHANGDRSRNRVVNESRTVFVGNSREVSGNGPAIVYRDNTAWQAQAAGNSNFGSSIGRLSGGGNTFTASNLDRLQSSNQTINRINQAIGSHSINQSSSNHVTRQLDHRSIHGDSIKSAVYKPTTSVVVESNKYRPIADIGNPYAAHRLPIGACVNTENRQSAKTSVDSFIESLQAKKSDHKVPSSSRSINELKLDMSK